MSHANKVAFQRNKRTRHAWLHMSRRCRDATTSPAVELEISAEIKINASRVVCLSHCVGDVIIYAALSGRSVDHQPRTHQRLVLTCVLGSHSCGSASCHLELTSDHRMD